eukprot:1179778-Rhodomonas_salina.7
MMLIAVQEAVQCMFLHDHSQIGTAAERSPCNATAAEGTSSLRCPVRIPDSSSKTRVRRRMQSFGFISTLRCSAAAPALLRQPQPLQPCPSLRLPLPLHRPPIHSADTATPRCPNGSSAVPSPSSCPPHPPHPPHPPPSRMCALPSTRPPRPPWGAGTRR